ncbi:MAG: sulfotransferase [Thiohalocapsa sp. PB-PSB1]|jgi:hypothetical protein|nr:MAG: hypothetical protein N838_10170 [Thiohalocapsa sp. PB-PSB1]QQO57299.1 MAG: sulfotransferase [Thiohalocapsa sp. PB-PSB1]
MNTKKLFEDLMGHPLIGARPGLILEMFRTRGVDREYLGRAAKVLLLAVANAPFAIWEARRYGRQIREHRLPGSPIFILGHWRSGTTHLHNLMSQDPNFGVLTYLHAYFQNCALLDLGIHRSLLRLALPRTRPMDAVLLAADLPAEEEFAIACVDDVGIINGLWFPRALLNYLKETVLFTGLDGSPDQAARQRWQSAYSRVITKASIASGGNRILLLKNPANTGRVSTLLAMYPDARFIYIHRNPYVVFPSTVRLYETLMSGRRFQRISTEDIEEIVLTLYHRIIERYEAERSRIPAGNLVELCFEDLEQEPLAVMESIYRSLELKGFEQVRPRFEAYLGTVRMYRKNTYRIDKDLIRRIDARWDPVMQRWKYAPVAEGSAR